MLERSEYAVLESAHNDPTVRVLLFQKARLLGAGLIHDPRISDSFRKTSALTIGFEVGQDLVHIDRGRVGWLEAQ